MFTKYSFNGSKFNSVNLTMKRSGRDHRYTSVNLASFQEKFIFAIGGLLVSRRGSKGTTNKLNKVSDLVMKYNIERN